MCGIAGFADSPRLDPVARRLTTDSRSSIAMCEVIRHRGPDDEGDARRAGGRARHAAAEHHRPVDRPSADSQRRRHRLGRLQRRDLQLPRAARRELEAAGHRFYTSSDTETIVHGYEEWGEERLRAGCAACSASRSGIARTRTLLLGARSRRHQAAALRRSRRPAVLRVGDQVACSPTGAVDREIDLDALDHYLAFLYTPRDRVDLQGHAQAAARALSCAGRTAGSTSRRYWQIAGARDVPRHRGGGRTSAASACSPTPSSRTWSATCRSARSSPAASTRASSSA